MARLSGAQIAIAVLVGALVVSGAATAAPGSDVEVTHAPDRFEHAPNRLEQVSGPSERTTTFVVEAYANGSARWTVRNVRPLENQTERQRFEAFAQRFRDQQTEEMVAFRERATKLTATGTNATGRSMRATSFEKHASIDQRTDNRGVVELSFLWTNFSARADGRVVIGDAFGSGFGIPNGTALTVRSGPKLDVQWNAVEPGWDSRVNDTESGPGSVTWNGPVTFTEAHPRVAFERAGESAERGLPIGGVALGGLLALAVAVLVGLGVYLRRTRRRSRESGSPAGDTPAGESEPDGPTAAESAPAGTDGGTATAHVEESTGPDSSGPPPAALRTDEDRVVDLLEDNGGRMRQAKIVEETGWSKSKVSTLLSQMADAGTVSKLRLGRENVVSLEGHEPDVASSPFDE